MQLLAILFGVVFVVVTVFVAILLRRVVSTNEVHIVQSSRSTASYGAGMGNGNTYYEWPFWVPIIGITKVVLPVSVFGLNLNNYEAYDVGRVPFVVDIVAFFRIEDSNLAAQRVANFEQLEAQLLNIVKGAIRTVLASHDIDEIMTQRSKFGLQFTEEVAEQLKQWGVVTVKNIELMDIRDAAENEVVHNIMAKKKSLIEMQSRQEVARNMKDAQIAEVDAHRDVETQKQVALEQIGLRIAAKDQQVGIAGQRAQQAINDELKTTKEKEMAVVSVAQVQQAEITKNVNVVQAIQNKETTILIAEGQLAQQQRQAGAIVAVGNAKADAEKAMQLAPVTAQITLAEKIAELSKYQEYLTTIRQIEANQVVGVEQAKALTAANIKVIANSGDPVGGVTSVMDLFTPKGGTQIGAMLEALAQTEQGKELLDKIPLKTAA